jgi:hypothetical protein
MKKITIELSESELAAVEKLLKEGESVETVAAMLIAETLVSKGLIQESAERAGKRFVRLDE